MNFIAWIAAVGGLLLIMALVSGWVRNLPITNYAIYLLVGFVFGPAVLGIVVIELPHHSEWLQRCWRGDFSVS